MATMRLLYLIISAITLAPLSAYGADLSAVSSWAYQLQNFDIDELAASPYELIVIDYSHDGSSNQAVTPAEIATLHAAGKKVLAYFSIGEAEDYRFYFRSSWIKRSRRSSCGVKLTSAAPSWLDAPNRDWCGNYKVRYWERSWQRILYGVRNGRSKSYLDQIIDAGFDGVYLDIVDGFEYWRTKRGERRKSAPKEMSTLVQRLARYARVNRGLSDFTVVPQNGAGIIDYLNAAQETQYFSAIDGIGAEDTYYFGDSDENNPLNSQDYTIARLKVFRDVGKRVFAIDYLTDETKVTDFFSRACGEGFLPQTSVRALDTLSAHRAGGCQD